MVKTLRCFLMSLMAMVCIGIQAEEVTFDFTGTEGYGMTQANSDNSNYYNPDPTTLSNTGDITVVLTGKTRWWMGDTSADFRMYKGSTITFSVPDGKTITSVVFSPYTSNLTSEIGSIDKGTWSGSSNSVTFILDSSASTYKIKTIVVTYGNGTSLKNPELAFSAESVDATIGESFTAPTFSKATDGAVTFSSSDESVATVDAATGAVTLVGAGVTTISAVSEETATYSAGRASYVLNVSTDLVAYPYEETFEASIGSFKINDVSLPTELTYVWKHDSGYKCMKASAFANSTNYASESWIISPSIDVPNDGIEKVVKFDQCINKYFANVAEEATVWYQVDGGEWTQLTVSHPAIMDNSSWSDFETEIIDLPSVSGKVKIGFKYVSATSAGTWEIRNFGLMSKEAAGIDGIYMDAPADQSIYNLAGQKLSKLAKGINIVNGKKIIK